MATKFYAICATAPELTGLSETNLLAEPHPTEFHEFYEVVGATGEGKPIGAGFPRCTWNYEDQILTAAQWNQLVSFFSGNKAYADVYIRTRTNEILDGTYRYRNRKATMHRPEVGSKAGYRFEDVTIEFTGLEVIA